MFKFTRNVFLIVPETERPKVKAEVRVKIAADSAWAGLLSASKMAPGPHMAEGTEGQRTGPS